MKHLAEEYKVVVASPNSEDTYCYSPGILKLENGRIIATMDFGGTGVVRMEGRVQDRIRAGRTQGGRHRGGQNLAARA